MVTWNGVSPSVRFWRGSLRQRVEGLPRPRTEPCSGCKRSFQLKMGTRLRQHVQLLLSCRASGPQFVVQIASLLIESEGCSFRAEAYSHIRFRVIADQNTALNGNPGPSESYAVFCEIRVAELRRGLACSITNSSINDLSR